MDEREIYAINLTKPTKTGGIEKKVNRTRQKQRNNAHWTTDNARRCQVRPGPAPAIEEGGADLWRLVENKSWQWPRVERQPMGNARVPKWGRASE